VFIKNIYIKIGDKIVLGTSGRGKPSAKRAAAEHGAPSVVPSALIIVSAIQEKSGRP